MREDLLTSERLPDDTDETLRPNRLDEFIGRVVRAGGGTAFALHKGEF